MTARALLLPAALGVATALIAASCSFDPFCVDGSAGCVDAGCADGVRNGDESDIDCGGSCGQCLVGLACTEDLDCETGRCAQSACCEAPCALWSRAWGSLVDDRATAIATAPDGSIYLAGRFSGAVDFGQGPLVSRGADIFVLRLGPDGALRWGRSFGGVLDDDGVELATTASGNVVIALGGASQSVDLGGGELTSEGARNIYLMELDADGHHVWSRGLHTTTEASASGVAITPDGEILLAGSMYDLDVGGDLLQTKGGLDAWVARLSPTGEHRWSKRFGDVWHDLGGRVATDGEGNVYINAYYSRSWSFGGEVLPSAVGNGCIAVAKLGPSGEHVWSHGYGTHGVSGQISTDLMVDRGGTVWLTGGFTGLSDFGGGVMSSGVGQSGLILALEPDGTFRFAHALGEHTAFGLGLTSDGAGGAVLVGSFRGNVDFGEGMRLDRGLDNLFVARFDRDGRAQWARNAGGQFTNEPALVVHAPDAGTFFVAGGFRGQLDPTFGAATSAGEADTFVLALTP